MAAIIYFSEILGNFMANTLYNSLAAQVYTEPPEDFKPTIQVASCYIEIEGKILLLQRGLEQSESGLWGVPAGKVEPLESHAEAAIRELFEETGIVASSSQVQSLGTLYIRKPTIEYVYSMFKIHIDKLPTVYLSDESQSYLWADFKEIKKLPLMTCANEALNLYYAQTISNQTPFLSVYLILRNQDNVLLLLRKNTGYGDGYYSLIAGHVDTREQATHAMVREAYEEAGIELSANNLKMVHASHRYSTRYNLDLFFECTTWKGTPTNKEPNKCEHLQYFPLNDLPPNLLPEIKQVFMHVANKSFYSEQGFH